MMRRNEDHYDLVRKVILLNIQLQVHVNCDTAAFNENISSFRMSWQQHVSKKLGHGHVYCCAASALLLTTVPEKEIHLDAALKPVLYLSALTASFQIFKLPINSPSPFYYRGHSLSVFQKEVQTSVHSITHQFSTFPHCGSEYSETVYL